MTNHLPDDFRQWPDDPFRLLGVEPTASEQDLKRAYTQLIRRFKPEHYPEEFRRIREAYDAALQRLKWLGYFPLPDPTPDQGEQPTRSQEARFEPLSNPERVAPRELVVSDPVEEAWALGVAGKREEAYSSLVELASRRPESADPVLRLYWLHAINPELDPTRTRHDWLAAALTRSRLSGPAVELYRRELAANPELALFGPYAQILSVSNATPSLLIWLARERLAAAGSGGWWARLDGDLCSLAEHSTTLDEVAWLSYLVAVMGYASLDEPAAVYKRCSGYLRDLQHLELSQVWAFDQIDEQKALAKAWRRGSIVPEPIREVVRNVWAGSHEGGHKALLRASAWVSNDVSQALDRFDRFAGDHNAQPFLITLKRVLDDVRRPGEPAYPHGLIRGMVTAFLANGIRKDYTAMRPALIRLLVDEAIDPEELVQACIMDSQFMTRSLVEFVRNDGTMWLVWNLANAARVCSL